MLTRLLIVEDDYLDMGRLVELLNQADAGEYTMTAASSISDAEVALANDSFDCILLDLSLPDSDGLQSLHRISAADKETPIIVLTGHDDYDLGISAIEAGAQDFLVKGDVNGNTIIRSAQWAMARAGSAPTRQPSTEEPRWHELDNASIAAAIVDETLQISSANPMFCRLVGRHEEDLAKTHIADIVSVDNISEFTIDIGLMLRNQYALQQKQVRIIRPNGTTTCLLVVSRIEGYPTEAPSLFVVVLPVRPEK